MASELDQEYARISALLERVANQMLAIAGSAAGVSAGTTARSLERAVADNTQAARELQQELAALPEKLGALLSQLGGVVITA